ncbi:hypothetical protein G9H62_00960 [Aquirufa ecclesiirivi]|uniref:hypothetical protein n=1 Tax=Aquirufa ecclesiirivi TaxID=2715124 RepID=UPI0022A8AAFD|nr:hypothetical protein [Aquirufa ecclesiirivi]MCZ2471394.1 hypothetical protein [Aquirufa ecclesiirivi]
MGIWNYLFGGNKPEEKAVPDVSLQEEANRIDQRLNPNLDVRKPHFDGRSESTWQRIFDRIRHDYELEGYQDALTTADNKYRDDNISIIKLDLQADIHEAEIAIKEYLKEIDFHINSRRKADLHDLVEELESRREICLDRLKTMEEIKLDVSNDTGTSTRIVLAYKRGFNKGLAALSMANIINRNI